MIKVATKQLYRYFSRYYKYPISIHVSPPDYERLREECTTDRYYYMSGEHIMILGMDVVIDNAIYPGYYRFHGDITDRPW